LLATTKGRSASRKSFDLGSKWDSPRFWCAPGNGGAVGLGECGAIPNPPLCGTYECGPADRQGKTHILPLLKPRNASE